MLFFQIENPTVRSGAVLKIGKSYGAVRCGFGIYCKSSGEVRCGFENLEILRCGSVRFSKEQWLKSGTPDRSIAVIGYPLNTQSHNDSGRHLIGRNHTASERSRMSVGCTRLWLNKSSKCIRLAYKPPDYGRTTRPPVHTHTRTRSRRELAPRHEGAHCLFFRLVALFPELFFVDCETPLRSRRRAQPQPQQ